MLAEEPTAARAVLPMKLPTIRESTALLLKQVTEENRQGEGQHLPGHTAFGQTVLVGFIHAVRSRLSV